MRKKLLRFILFTLSLIMVNSITQASNPLPSGLVDTFVTFTASHSGRCMDQATWNFQNGGNIHQWQCNGGYNQLWVIRHLGNNQYRIVNAYSGKCADESTWSTQNGGNIHQWDCHNGNNQRWTFEYLGASSTGAPIYRIRNVHSQKCLDVANASTSNGGNIHQWTCGSGTNQRWILFPGFH